MSKWMNQEAFGAVNVGYGVGMNEDEETSPRLSDKLFKPFGLPPSYSLGLC